MMKCFGPVPDAFQELFIRHGRVPGHLPDFAWKLFTGSAGGKAVLIDAAGIDGAGLSFGGVEDLAAGFVAACAGVTVQRAG